MKKTTSIVILLMGMFMISCSSSKEARSAKGDIKGDWVLQTITTEGVSGITKTTIFNEAEFSCFIGSSWHFIGNNSMGTYTLVDPKKDCPSLKRNIRWSVYEDDTKLRYLQFKRLDDKRNAMDNGDGYRLVIVQLDDTQMKLRTEITFNGAPSSLTYNFVRQ